MKASCVTRGKCLFLLSRLQTTRFLSNKGPTLCLFFPWPCCLACAILVPWSGLKPSPLQWKHGVLTTGPPGWSLSLCLNKKKLLQSQTLLEYLSRSWVDHVLFSTWSLWPGWQICLEKGIWVHKPGEALTPNGSGGSTTGCVVWSWPKTAVAGTGPKWLSLLPPSTGVISARKCCLQGIEIGHN